MRLADYAYPAFTTAAGAFLALVAAVAGWWVWTAPVPTHGPIGMIMVILAVAPILATAGLVASLGWVV